MSKTTQPTVLKTMHIQNFRNLQDVEIEFGTRITVISGKNGTAKSTILGLIAQVFNFDKDYVKNTDLNYQTLNGKKFKSDFSEHFRLSEKYDRPGDMNVGYQVYDAYFGQEIPNLRLGLYDYKDRKHRTVVRNNLPTPYSKNTSRNVTHPVIYLNLKRLYPIAERDESVVDNGYLIQYKDEFISVCSEIIGKSNNSITSTKGSIINSSVVHGDTYDHKSVSAGEDNIGQIVQALFSFKKLSEDYTDYHGGLLIIDEIDAGLFPFAQDKIIDKLQYYARTYNVQIIVTSHSPIIIEKIFDKSKNNPKEFKNIFLSQAHGVLEIKKDYQWTDIYADLFITTKVKSGNIVFPEVNVYFEDGEAYDFFNRLVTSRKIKKVIKMLKDVSMGCDNYHYLISKNIPEFEHKSIIVLDGDEAKSDKKKHKKTFSTQKNIATLPTIQPPDRLLFKFLFELPPNDDFWHNTLGFTKEVFFNTGPAQAIINRLKLTNDNIYNFDHIVEQDLNDQTKGGLREMFKTFYKDERLQQMIANKSTCPFAYFLRKNPNYVQEFNRKFIECLKYVLQYGFGEQKSKIESYFNVQA
ncbi:hypothetical protein MHD_06720 [Mannheimia granulomatis]|uniref:ATPase AAA n=1 Tax=Mannheimia granulomatis TaxID=85402 RepID=A0A011NE26_9PAST|nr:AAA family ATPase [Mannheimia granulomatis]EXI62812.1 ATPase AAA [Mannheimia granulomatis]RGE48168.1 hypothetical protein MHD_06720 [Mannheimia granulomatis]